MGSPGAGRGWLRPPRASWALLGPPRASPTPINPRLSHPSRTNLPDARPTRATILVGQAILATGTPEVFDEVHVQDQAITCPHTKSSIVWQMRGWGNIVRRSLRHGTEPGNRARRRLNASLLFRSITASCISFNSIAEPAQPKLNGWRQNGCKSRLRVWVCGVRCGVRPAQPVETRRVAPSTPPLDCNS